MRLDMITLAPIAGIGLVLALARGLGAQVVVPEPVAPLAVHGGAQGSSLLEVAQGYAGALGLELRFLGAEKYARRRARGRRVSLAEEYRRQLAWRSWPAVLDALPPRHRRPGGALVRRRDARDRPGGERGLPYPAWRATATAQRRRSRPAWPSSRRLC